MTALRSHHGIACYRADQRDSQPWMNLTEAARQLRMSARTLRVAAERGEIAAEHPLPDGPWVFNRDELASTAAKTLVNRVALHKLGVAVPSVEQARPRVFKHIASWGSMKRGCRSSPRQRRPGFR